MKHKPHIIFAPLLLLSACRNPTPQPAPVASTPTETTWAAPDTSTLGADEHSLQIKYGRALISNTAYYLGPKGTVAHISNGMNCQNCHLDAGTKPFGNNYSGVAANYPKFRARSGTVEDIYKRVNDCLQRSLNGQALDTLSPEMQAIKAYILWLGAGVPKNTQPTGVGLTKLAYMDQPADPAKGRDVYTAKCQVCHGADGTGKPNPDGFTYQYPPLWGSHSYNTGAGLYRISLLAGYIKSNMPFGADYQHPQLSDEEAWDVAAFINSQPRPVKKFAADWPDISLKPADHPFGPYADTFTERQHKYGPYLPIAEYHKARAGINNPLK